MGCRYATIREENGRLYLYIKTIERAHLPSKMWQKIRLRRQYTEALKQIDEHMAYWPKFLVHKQRLTKITQYLIRMRRLELKVKPKLVPLARRCAYLLLCMHLVVAACSVVCIVGAACLHT